MNTYKKAAKPTGQPMYYHNGKLTSLSRVAPSVARMLEALPIGGVYTEGPAEAAPAERVCIFCGEPGTCRKFVLLRTVFLCQDDYNVKTTGEVGQRIREQDNAKEEN